MEKSLIQYFFFGKNKAIIGWNPIKLKKAGTLKQPAFLPKPNYH